MKKARREFTPASGLLLSGSVVEPERVADPHSKSPRREFDHLVGIAALNCVWRHRAQSRGFGKLDNSVELKISARLLGHGWRSCGGAARGSASRTGGHPK